MLSETEIEELENLLDRLERNSLVYFSERELLTKIIETFKYAHSK